VAVLQSFLAHKIGRVPQRLEHLLRCRAPLHSCGIGCHLLQILDIDLAHLELGNENAGHNGITMLRFLDQFFHSSIGQDGCL
jgi:hypothetical protein